MTTAELYALCVVMIVGLINIVLTWKRESEIVRLHEWIYDLSKRVRELERKENE